MWMLWQMQYTQSVHILAWPNFLSVEGKKEVDEIKWEDVGLKVRGIYENM